MKGVGRPRRSVGYRKRDHGRSHENRFCYQEEAPLETLIQAMTVFYVLLKRRARQHLLDPTYHRIPLGYYDGPRGCAYPGEIR
jgi:hypothetical protein